MSFAGKTAAFPSSPVGLAFATYSWMRVLISLQSIEVIRNAKIQRPSVCNALDTCLIHNSIAKDFYHNW